MTDREFNEQLAAYLDALDDLIFVYFINLSEATRDALIECRAILN